MPERPTRSSGAGRVAAGILLSRLAGLLRDRAMAHYFGVGAYADAFRVALRLPNLLQNLLGEGTVSAAFIPPLSRMLAEGRREEAGRFAGAVFGLLLALAAAISLVGVLLAEPLVAVFAPGLLQDAPAVASGSQGVDRYPLVVWAVRIIFPMAGVLVLSAWTLGVLNAHRRFFLPYVAPVLWNAAIIAGLFAAAAGALAGLGASPGETLFRAACLGALLGGLLQFLVQLPLVIRLLGGLRIRFSTRVEGVRDALAAVGPVIAGRGAYQISGYLDVFLASFIATGALAALGWAQTLYILPVSLFGMSVAAAELPELSRSAVAGKGELDADRLRQALSQMAFLVVPTTVGYLAFGWLIVGALYRTSAGAFSLADNWLVYLALAGYSLGLVGTTWARLLQNAFFALGNTKTPARVAFLRVAVSATVAAASMFLLDRLPLSTVAGVAGADALRLGVVGLTLAAGVSGWVELLVLRQRLSRQLEDFGLPWGILGRAGLLALVSAVPAVIAWRLVSMPHVALSALVVVGIFAAIYLAGARLCRFEELAIWISRATRSRRPSS